MTTPGPRGQLPSGRHGLSEDVVATSQCSRIFDAMRQAIDEYGYAGASLLRITKLAGISRKTFYVHFASKEACFIAVYKDARQRISAPALRARARPGRWPARTVAAIAALLESLAADPTAARIVIVEVLAAGDRAREVRNAHILEVTRDFAPTAADRAELGLTPRADGRSTEVVLGGISELVYREIVEGRTEHLPDLLPVVAYVVLSPHLGPLAARAEVLALTGREV